MNYESSTKNFISIIQYTQKCNKSCKKEIKMGAKKPLFCFKKLFKFLNESGLSGLLLA